MIYVDLSNFVQVPQLSPRQRMVRVHATAWGECVNKAGYRYARIGPGQYVMYKPALDTSNEWRAYLWSLQCMRFGENERVTAPLVTFSLDESPC